MEEGRLYCCFRAWEAVGLVREAGGPSLCERGEEGPRAEREPLLLAPTPQIRKTHHYVRDSR